MNTSEKIRALARKKMPTAEIARELGIRYQHAYNVLRHADMLPAPRNNAKITKPRKQKKQQLARNKLIEAGFSPLACWTLNDDGEIRFDTILPKEPGVYAICIADDVQYVGVASSGLANRLKFYCKPGPTQKTSQRVNLLIKKIVADGNVVEVIAAMPEDTVWNGLPVRTLAGLELGLIQSYDLPWNIRSS